MEVMANNHSKRYPIELSYRETANKTVSFVFSLENAKKLLSDALFRNFDELTQKFYSFKTYEEACEAAIKYCLENLI